MKLFRKSLTDRQIGLVVDKYGTYFKVTGDIENNLLVVGCKLHSDALPLLKKYGGMESNIWGGWVNLDEKMVETNGVLNIRDENPSMEILDNIMRERFLALVKNYFKNVFN